jgi:hypothetical protein
LFGKPERKRPPGTYRRRKEHNIKWIIGKFGVKIYTGFIWLRILTCGHRTEPLWSTKGVEFLDKVNGCEFFKKDSVLWS